MPDREKVVKGLEICSNGGFNCCITCPYEPGGQPHETDCEEKLMADALELLKEQESLTRKMWNALFAEEDKLEKRFIGTDEHDRWFLVYRDWLQRGFGIAINVIAEQEER